MKINPAMTKLNQNILKYKDTLIDGARTIVEEKLNAFKNKSKVDTDYQALTQQNFIGEYLNYKYYQDGIFINDGSFGFCLFASPLTGASEQLANRLMGLFALRWPQEATLSLMLYSSKELKNRLEAWVDKRKNISNPLIKEMVNTRAKYFSTGVDSSLIKDEKMVVKDYRMVISVTFNGKLEKNKAAEIQLFKKAFYSSLNNLKLNPQAINPDMLLDLMDEIFNRKKGFRDASYKHNPYTELRKQVTGPSTRVLIDKDGCSFNNTIVRGVTIKEYPSTNPLSESLDLIGDMLDDVTQLSSQFLYCTNIWFPDKSSLKTTINAKSARSIQNAESPMAKWVPDFITKAADWKEVLKITADGQSMYYCNQAFYTFSELGESSFAETDLIDVFSNKGWNVTPISFLEYPVFLSCLPMQFDNNRYKALSRLKLTKLLPAWCITNLLVAFGEWQGNSYDTGMLMLGRRGQLSCLDIFKSNGNYNVAIAADSGSGKSFFMNDFVKPPLLVPI